VIAYRAMLDVPRELVRYLARLLAAERRAVGTCKGSRALTCLWVPKIAAVLRGLRILADQATESISASDPDVVVGRRGGQCS
jgi:hypothetical protein